MRGRIWYARPYLRPASTKVRKAQYIWRMEPRAENKGIHYPIESVLPKWKLKANWILRQYARIWREGVGLYTINFDVAFKDVFVQFFIDEGLIEKDAECCIKFAEAEYEKYASQHEDEVGIGFFTSAERWRWIVEKGLFSFLKPKFLSDGTIYEVLDIAEKTEIDLEIYNPKNATQPWIDYEYCESLPCVPPHDHEWVEEWMNDPWLYLGK